MLELHDDEIQKYNEVLEEKELTEWQDAVEIEDSPFGAVKRVFPDARIGDLKNWLKAKGLTVRSIRT